MKPAPVDASSIVYANPVRIRQSPSPPCLLPVSGPSSAAQPFPVAISSHISANPFIVPLQAFERRRGTGQAGPSHGPLWRPVGRAAGPRPLALPGATRGGAGPPLRPGAPHSVNALICRINALSATHYPTTSPRPLP